MVIKHTSHAACFVPVPTHAIHVGCMYMYMSLKTQWPQMMLLKLSILTLIKLAPPQSSLQEKPCTCIYI